jgi:type I restriction enzyme S subunit
MAGEWKSAPLSELCEQIADCPHSTPLWTNSGVIVLRNQNIRGGRLDLSSPSYTDEAHFDQRSRRAGLRSGDLVLTREAPMGEVCMIPDNLRCCLGQRMVMLRPDPEKCDSRFLLYSIQSDTVQHEIKVNEGTGSTVSNLRIPLLEALPIPYPPLAEQKAIAAVLGALDDKIELNQRMNATLEAMARALFQSWFVDFDPVRARLDGWQPGGLDPGTAALFPEHLEDSPLGKVPIDWEVTTLESVLSVLETGGRPKGGVAGIMSGVPSIGAESIVSVGVFDFGKTKYVPIEFYERMKKGRIESHDVLLYKDGGRPGEYEPHVSMFGDEFPFEECSINEHVYRLRSNDHLSQEYLYFWMTSEFALAEMRIKGTGVAIPGLNSTAVRSLAVLVPPQPIVEAFTNQASPLVTRILSNAKQSRILATLRDTLLPKLLSGELQVPEAIRLIEAQA